MPRVFVAIRGYQAQDGSDLSEAEIKEIALQLAKVGDNCLANKPVTTVYSLVSIDVAANTDEQRLAQGHMPKWQSLSVDLRDRINAAANLISLGVKP
jgi:hypothetical protein